MAIKNCTYISPESLGPTSFQNLNKCGSGTRVVLDLARISLPTWDFQYVVAGLDTMIHFFAAPLMVRGGGGGQKRGLNMIDSVVYFLRIIVTEQGKHAQTICSVIALMYTLIPVERIYLMAGMQGSNYAPDIEIPG